MSFSESRTESGRQHGPFHYFRGGIRYALANKGIVSVLWFLDLVLAGLLTFVVIRLLDLDPRLLNFGPELLQNLDPTLLLESGATFDLVANSLLLAILAAGLILFLWRRLAYAGVVSKRVASTEGFWRGVGKWGPKAFVLALIFFFANAVLVGIAVFCFVMLGGLISQQPTVLFWTLAGLLPCALVAIVSGLDLLHDYARNALIYQRKGIGKSFFDGWKFGARQTGTTRLYLLFWLLAACLFALTFFVDMGVETSMVMIIAIFAMQQLLLWTRSLVTVGWLSGQAELFMDRAPAARFAEIDVTEIFSDILPFPKREPKTANGDPNPESPSV